MARTKALFNVARLVSDSGKDTSPEVSFLNDFDYTSRKLNAHEPCYHFKKITKELNPEYFDVSYGKCVNIVVIDTLPEVCTKDNDYEQTKIIYHTNDQSYYIGVLHDGKPSKRYKPSSMKCLRSMYYQIIGADLDEQQQKTSDFYGICESGTDRHERVQFVISQMRKYGCDCDFIDVSEYIKENNLTHLVVESKKNYETKVYDTRRNIVFLCDGLLKYKGEYFLFEFKTESSYKWMNRNYVDDSHRYQAYTYALEFGIRKVIFLYENRDVCTKKPYLLEVTDENIEFIEKRIKDCDEYVSQRVTPPKEESVTKRECQYCEYKTQCKIDNYL